MKKIFIGLFLLFLIQITHAQQFDGGNGDGHDVENVNNTTLVNTNLMVLFKGGNGDGQDVYNYFNTTLSSLNLTLLYKGGNGDGHDMENILNTTLLNTNLMVLYNGGNGDGHDTENILNTTLLNTNILVLFKGGNGDGHDIAGLTNTNLGNFDFSVLFKGSNGDGHDIESILNTTLLNTNILVLFKGGNGDGHDIASLTNTNLGNFDFSMLFKGSNGDGHDIESILNTRLQDIIVVFNWTGKTSKNWATSTNWSTSAVPIATNNVIIPNVTNQPTIESGTTAIVNNLTVDAASSLQIEGGGDLTVRGDLTQNGVFTINSDATSNGSFILEGHHLGTEKVLYNRYVSSSPTISEGWYLISAPVSGKNIDDFYSDVATNGIKRGIGSYINTNPINTKWTYYTTANLNPGSFEPGKGYTIKKASAGALSFDGFVITDSVLYPVYDTGDQYNAIGNPFTSYINSSTFLDNVSEGILTENTVFLWDSSGNGGTGEYISKNQITNYLVAPGQGFFVKVSASGTVKLAESFQTHGGGNTFLKNENKPKITLFLKDGTNQKYTEIYYIDGKTTGFDNGFDSSMFDGVQTDFAIFTQLVTNNQGKNLAIQSLPKDNYNTMVIPIGVKAISGKELNFSANLTSLPSNLKVFLEDRKTNTFTRIDEENSFYKTTLSKTLNGIGRFYLHVTETALNTETNEDNLNISVYTPDNATLKITGLPQGDTGLKLYNLLGKQLMNISFETTGVETITLPYLAKGVYLVILKTDKEKITKKIFLD
ncbi:T9SS type A sorting domain-containing protein [Polaribacter sp. L3A8]|uniref:T9SS type A sorting domain-containing protein n=1 Tax=Polaribacter sp. L3A8 TaxID=2686361 RepID=UPI00131D1227|nr:T9SS type A sorting domain-containing protein [Polaribacter sp. L3A8]